MRFVQVIASLLLLVTAVAQVPVIRAQDVPMANATTPQEAPGDQPPATARDHIQHAIRAGRVPSRGVNLGGWLVAEHWMTMGAEIWWGLSEDQANAGEQTAFRNTFPRELAIRRFQAHRESFITERDIAEIARAGLNTVRVPVGYWIVGFDRHDPSNQRQWENYAPGGLQVLDRLIRDWAVKHNVAVLLSMHAAKGSQNGMDHSSPEEPGKSHWAHYPENVASTLDAVTFLAGRYKHDRAFLGIALLNEPAGSTTNDVLYRYYEDAYFAIRHWGQNDCILTIAPRLWEQSAGFMSGLLPGATNVWVEWHRYFVWGFENATPEEIMNGAIDKYRQDLEAWRRVSDKPMFIGEYSLATHNNKIRDPGMLREFGRRQLQVLRAHAVGGWTFWSWRILGDDGAGTNTWSLRNLIRNGLFPGL